MAMTKLKHLPAVLSSSISKLPMPPMFPNDGICIPPPNIVDPIWVVDEDEEELNEEELIFEEDDIIFDISPDIIEPKSKCILFTIKRHQQQFTLEVSE